MVLVVIFCHLDRQSTVRHASHPQINYFERRQGYYKQFHKRQRLLAKGPKDEPNGPTSQAAVTKFAEIMPCPKRTRPKMATSFARSSNCTQNLRNQGRKRTLAMVVDCLNSANEEFGSLMYEELKL